MEGLGTEKAHFSKELSAKLTEDYGFNNPPSTLRVATSFEKVGF